MSGNPTYDWVGAPNGGNNMGQWHQQVQSPSQPTTHANNNMNYNNTVPANSNNNINTVIGGLPNSDTRQQPHMQSQQPIHSMPMRQPQHQNMQQQQHQMQRNPSLYQPAPGPTTSPSEAQISQQQQQHAQYQQQQHQQHPQQSQQHYSLYSPSEYWSPPISNQQSPHGQPMAQSHTAQRGFHQQQQQNHNSHKQSPTATPLSHQTSRGQLPASHTPDRSNIPLSASSLQQQAQNSFHNSKELHQISPDQQQMIPTMSPHQHPQQHQQHPGGVPGSMHVMHQNHQTAPSNNISSASPNQHIQMSPIQQQTQQPPGWQQQPDPYYLQQNQNRSFSGPVHPYNTYDNVNGGSVPDNTVSLPTQSIPTRPAIGQKSGINNSDRAPQVHESSWSSISEPHYTQQQASQGSNDTYYNYDGSGYYPVPNQPNVGSNQQIQNNVNNIYENTPYADGHSQMPSQNDGMGYSMSYGHMPHVSNAPMQQNQPMAQTSQVSMHYQQPQQSFMTRPPQQTQNSHLSQSQAPNSQMHVPLPLHPPQQHTPVQQQIAPPKKRTRAKRDPNKPPAQKKQSPKKVSNGQGTTGGTRRKKAPKDGNDKSSGYALFFSERQPQIKSLNPRMEFGDISKRVSAEWHSLSDDQKNRYNKIVTVQRLEQIDMKASEQARNLQSGQMIYQRETEQQTSC